jgi:superfamily II DNA or RNA helicase
VFQPYPYQTECLEAINGAREEGRKKVLIVMASGLGKTVTMGFDAKKWLETHGGRVLYLCHQNDILYQAKTTFEAILGGKHSYGFFHGDEKTAHRVDCLFASFATMVKHMRRFVPDEFDYIVVDESHHSHAETFKMVVEYFLPKFLLGATATPDRLDERNIRDIYGDEVYNLPLTTALARGLLTPVDYRLLSDEIQLSKKIETPEGRVSIRQLNRTVFVPKRDDEILQIVNKYAAQFENPRIIYFCSSVRHCNHLATVVPDCLPIHSRVPTKERGVRLELFRQGILSTALTVDCFNEGVDVPQANVLVFLRSTSSSTVFFQQLGRGLRVSQGKDKVLVLDFVANCERIRQVHELWKAVRAEAEELSLAGSKAPKPPVEPMMLNIDGVNFDEKIVQILDVFKRLSLDFYPTWQEASTAALKLGIGSSPQYKKLYWKDQRLPSHPNGHYADFPGWTTFLGKPAQDHYPTWQEAGAAAVKLGITSFSTYLKKHKADPRLPSTPGLTYPDFPGWYDFVGKEKPTEKYATWQEGSKAAIALGIQSSEQYRLKCKEDPKLLVSPQQGYKDFPGWDVYLGRTSYYVTWQEASAAALKLGITSAKKYRLEKAYTADPKLPSNPQIFYSDFPSWKTFFGKEIKDFYPTWQEASAATQALGVKTQKDYAKNYKRDNRLPASPPEKYPDFPGWIKFLDKE